jgi:hypothetical protein
MEVFGGGEITITGDWGFPNGTLSEPLKKFLSPRKSPILSLGANSPCSSPKKETFTAAEITARANLASGRTTQNLSALPPSYPSMGVVSCISGWEHSLALTRDGSLFGWGSNIEFQLGIKLPEIMKDKIYYEDTNNDSEVLFLSPKPVDFPFSESVVWMAAGITRPKLVSGIKFKIPSVYLRKFRESTVRWLFLGRADPNSVLFILPIEVLFNFVDLNFK